MGKDATKTGAGTRKGAPFRAAKKVGDGAKNKTCSKNSKYKTAVRRAMTANPASRGKLAHRLYGMGLGFIADDVLSMTPTEMKTRVVYLSEGDMDGLGDDFDLDGPATAPAAPAAAPASVATFDVDGPAAALASAPASVATFDVDGPVAALAAAPISAARAAVTASDFNMQDAPLPPPLPTVGEQCMISIADISDDMKKVQKLLARDAPTGVARMKKWCQRVSVFDAAYGAGSSAGMGPAMSNHIAVKLTIWRGAVRKMSGMLSFECPPLND